jgi:hypothetical protein
MYIESVPNRNSPPAILLRESYRENGKVRKATPNNYCVRVATWARWYNSTPGETLHP